MGNRPEHLHPDSRKVASMTTSAPKPPSANKPAQGAEYVLGTDQTESVRLGLQHRLWAESAHRLWERAGVMPGASVLDVGCGPGHAALDMAEIVGPTGRVVGVDESAVFLKHLHDEAKARRLGNVQRALGDVQDLAKILADQRGTFDVAYARWVFCFVKDPSAVLAGIASSLKPGGRVAIQDYFSYESMTLAPRHEAFTRVIRAVGASWRLRGGDPDIVSRLPALGREVGLELDYLAINPRVARPGMPMWHWPDSFWKSYVPRLVETGHLTPSDRQEFESLWASASKNPDVFMMLPPVFDLVLVKR
jgi:ubiquinone/menaquinone biosynthesis C-methylase UbiE